MGSWWFVANVQVFLISLFAPVKALYRSSRMFFLRCMQHILFAPFFKVHTTLTPFVVVQFTFNVGRRDFLLIFVMLTVKVVRFWDYVTPEGRETRPSGVTGHNHFGHHPL